ncbi:hypothetical protein CPC08DRAFT_211225 [Agrocybe pediades]|nr:hypothetical protein CPC08DRAFT_211225 [Agrocybe pediades]
MPRLQASDSDGCLKGRDTCPGDESHLIDRQLYGLLVGLMHGLIHRASSDQDKGK